MSGKHSATRTNKEDSVTKKSITRILRGIRGLVVFASRWIGRWAITIVFLVLVGGIVFAGNHLLNADSASYEQDEAATATSVDGDANESGGSVQEGEKSDGARSEGTSSDSEPDDAPADGEDAGDSSVKTESRSTELEFRTVAFICVTVLFGIALIFCGLGMLSSLVRNADYRERREKELREANAKQDIRSESESSADSAQEAGGNTLEKASSSKPQSISDKKAQSETNLECEVGSSGVHVKAIAKW